MNWYIAVAALSFAAGVSFAYARMKARQFGTLYFSRKDGHFHMGVLLNQQPEAMMKMKQVTFKVQDLDADFSDPLMKRRDSDV